MAAPDLSDEPFRAYPLDGPPLGFAVYPSEPSGLTVEPKTLERIACGLGPGKCLVCFPDEQSRIP